MSEPIQDFDHRNSQYERPTMKWVCGWKGQGQPCHVGPNSRGQCQVHRECIPFDDGDGYVCARPPFWGGKCKDGPLPDGTCCEARVQCQPRRNLFARRRVAVVLTSALAFGFLLIMFGGSNAEQFISPGDLSAPHHIATKDCSNCHTSSNAELDKLASWALRPQEVVTNESAACRKCHHQLGEFALNPHNQDPEVLAAVTKRFADLPNKSGKPWILSIAELGPGIPKNSNGELECSTCHHEHRGKSFDLKHMSDQQCQTCHANKFHSFDRGHPKFTDFPYERRVRIHFNHQTHYGTHFANFKRLMPNGEAPKGYKEATIEDSEIQTEETTCYSCHAPDHTGENMLTQSFEVMCGKCHGPQIQETALPGIAFLALPTVRVDELSELKIAVGEWPNQSGGNFQLNDIPAFMQLLLADDKEFIKATQTLQGVQLGALSDELDDEKKQAVQIVLWSIKRLIHQLVVNFDKRVGQSIDQVAASSIAGDKLNLLSGQLPSGMSLHEMVVTAQKLWFPNLADEIDELAMDKPRDSKKVELESARLDTQINDLSGQLQKEDLADDKRTDLMDALKHLQHQKMELQLALERASDRGWYRNDSETSIRYRSSGHADPFLKEWIDLTGANESVAQAFSTKRQSDESQPIGLRGSSAIRLFSSVADPKASFRCTDCHTVDYTNERGLVANWIGVRGSLGEHKLTKFSHAPHVLLVHSDYDTVLHNKRCNYCHNLKDTQLSFVSTGFLNSDNNWRINSNAHQVDTSGFSPMNNATCVDCHNSQQLSGSCLQCHNYHIGSFSLGH